MPGRQTVSALIVAAALAGCTGEGPTLGSLSSGVEATAALQQPGATLDLPAAYNPFSDRPASTAGRREVMENPSIAEIMKTGDLPEMALGRNDAPVTIVQYASMTCPHCRQFQIETFPVLKREYIDTGKVRYVLRAEFPIFAAQAAPFHYLDNAATGQICRAAMAIDPPMSPSPAIPIFTALRLARSVRPRGRRAAPRP